MARSSPYPYVTIPPYKEQYTRALYAGKQGGSGNLLEGRLYLLDLILGETELGRPDHAVHLVRSARAHDGRADGRVPERPGDGDLCRRPAVLLPDRVKQLDQLQVLREPRLLEVGVVAAPVVGGEVLDALGGHLAGEQATPHRRVDDDADVVLLAIGQYLILDLALEHGVGRLEGLDRGDLLRPLHLLDVEVRDPDVPDLALLLQLGHRGPALLDVLVGPGPVDLVEVYYVGLQAPQAVLALTLHRVLLENVVDLATLIPDERGLGEDVRALVLRHVLEGPRDELFGVPQAVGGGGVDPVHTELDGPPYSPHGLVVVLRPPGGGPAAPADGPAAEADRCDLHARLAELARLQSSLLRTVFYECSTSYMSIYLERDRDKR